MTFDRNGLGRVGGGVSDDSAVWSYYTTDSLSGVGVTGYFNEADTLKLNDYIQVMTPTEYGAYKIIALEPVEIESLTESQGLTSVSTDGTLTGDGTAGNPLGVNDIVNLINQALGVNFWQQGISNAIFVNDVSEDSPELSPYLADSGPNAGKWEVGSASIDGTQLIVINTDRNSLSAVMEREFAKVGELQIVSSSPGQTKGLVMSAGVGVPEMQHMISSDTSGALRIETIMFSDDVTRPAYNITNNTDGFFFQGVGWALGNPGSIDTRTIDIDCEFLLLQQSYCVIGSACEFFNFKNANMDAPFLGSARGFDLSSVPTSGKRIIEVDSTVNTTSGDNPGDAAFLIDTDNGDNVGVFGGTRNEDPVGNRYILATNDTAFNDNPQKSLNFEFNVQNFVITQRIAELGIVAPPRVQNPVGSVVISATATFTDMVGPTYILDETSTSGFDLDPTTGAIIYKLNTPATLKIKYIISGFKLAQGVADYSFTPLYKPAGGVYERITVEDGTNTAFIETFDEFTPQVDPNSTALNFTQRVENVDDEIKIQIANLSDEDDFKPTSIQMVVEI